MQGINSNKLFVHLNVTILAQLLATINTVFNCENLIIVSHDNYTKSLEFNIFMQQIAVDQLKPVFLFTTSQNMNLKLRINKNSLALIFMRQCEVNNCNDIREITHRTLLSFRTNKSVFILESENCPLKDLVDWLWYEQFVNSLILCGNEIYSFDPFPYIQITKPKVNEYFLKRDAAFYNLKGYYLNTPVIESLPRLYPIKDGQGNNLLSGPNGYLFTHFIRFMNMTWNGFNEDYWLQAFNKSGIALYETMSLFTIQNTSAEIAAEAPLIVHSSFAFDNSYPTDTVHLCLMIPVQNALPNYLYLFRPFSIDLWIMLTFLIIYTTAMFYILLKATYFRKTPVDIFCCFQQSFNVIINASNLEDFRLPRASWIILYLPLFVFGFTISSFYSTYLAAFLTTILYENDLETIDDLIHSNVKIMIVDWQLEDLFQYFNIHIKAMINFVNVSYEFSNDVVVHRNSLNTSYGYLVPSDMWKIFQKEQELLRRPIFKLSQICYTTFFSSFPIKQDSYIEQPIKYFIMLSQQFGLFEAWEHRSFRDAINAKIYYLLKDNTENDYEALSVSFFAIGWWLLFCGLFIGCVTCGIEVLLKFLMELKIIHI